MPPKKRSGILILPFALIINDNYFGLLGHFYSFFSPVKRTWLLSVEAGEKSQGRGAPKRAANSSMAARRANTANHSAGMAASP